MRVSKLWMLAGLTAALVACEGTSASGPQLSLVTVRLIDGPGAAITDASAWISTVYLIGENGTSRDIIATGPSTEYHLLDLQGGVTALLGQAMIPAGDYSQLRLIVDSATVLLDGETDPRSLKVPSGMQTGIKVEFGGPVHILPGRTDLTVDFSVDKSFVVTGPTPPRQVLFKPVLHGIVTDQSGSISGTSSPVEAMGLLLAISGTDTVATDSADASSGAYTLPFLPPGDYTVVDSTTVAGFVTKSAPVTVGVGEHVTQDFTLTP
jgi:Domain of unknown function (DUF4382)